MLDKPKRAYFEIDDVERRISDLPRWYGMTVNGDCMVPLFKTGDTLVIDKETWPERGDLAVIYLRGSRDGKPGVFPWAKRITMGMWQMKLPYIPHPSSNVMPLVSFESNLPGQAWTVQATALYGLHKIVGRQEDVVWDGNAWVRRPKGKGRRRGAKPHLEAA